MGSIPLKKFIQLWSHITSMVKYRLGVHVMCQESHIKKIKRIGTLYKIDELFLSFSIGFEIEPHTIKYHDRCSRRVIRRCMS